MKTPVYAYYFPNWHVTPQNEIWHGKGWTEWQCVKYATPRFPGHVQPKLPLWGYEDESLPEVMEKKIDAALSHGIDGFIFDWYWYPDIGPYRIDCLDKGFLKAKNAKDFRFSVMWCDHTPIAAHPSLYNFPSLPLIENGFSEESFLALTDYCITHYFGLPNYIRVDGKPYFSMYSMEGFVGAFGEAHGRELLEGLRERARRAGIGEIVIGVCPHVYPTPTEAAKQIEFGRQCRALGIDVLACYGWERMPNCTTFEYKDLIRPIIDDMQRLEKNAALPLCPSVMFGCDTSPRTCQSDMFDTTRGFPFCPIGLHNKPEYIEGVTRELLGKLRDGTFGGRFLTLEAWNEWTEGSYIEPCAEYGYGMLEAVRDGQGENK